MVEPIAEAAVRIVSGDAGKGRSRCSDTVVITELILAEKLRPLGAGVVPFPSLDLPVGLAQCRCLLATHFLKQSE